jgi:hypothetical protein
LIIVFVAPGLQRNANSPQVIQATDLLGTGASARETRQKNHRTQKKCSERRDQFDARESNRWEWQEYAPSKRINALNLIPLAIFAAYAKSAGSFNDKKP